ncbi:MAG: type II toxin-antitoxin system RelE/ParE family toxin [Myxococcota bacterium]
MKAAHDVRRAAIWTREEAGSDAERRLVAAIDRAVRQLRRSPLSGSPRFGHRLGIPDLRCVVLERVPWTLFSVLTQAGIDVVRVLHQRSDIPRHLQER